MSDRLLRASLRWASLLWACALTLAGAAPLLATAGEAQDRLFALGVLDAVETGRKLVYSHARTGSVAAAAAAPGIADGRVEVLLIPVGEDGRNAEVTLHDGARVRAFNPFPAAAGNPLLMIFMETNVQTMAAATGGSPHYIRNRMREALRSQDAGRPVEIDLDGTRVAAERFNFAPFAGDPNAPRMGAFAELEISFVLSEAVPGHYAVLEAVSGAGPDGTPALRETMTYRRIEEAEG